MSKYIYRFSGEFYKDFIGSAKIPFNDNDLVTCWTSESDLEDGKDYWTRAILLTDLAAHYQRFSDRHILRERYSRQSDSSDDENIAKGEVSLMVYYVDYGQVQKVYLQNVRFLDKKFLKVSRQFGILSNLMHFVFF